MNSEERNELVWAESLEPLVSRLPTNATIYETLRRGFENMTIDERHAVETALTEHERAIALACYHVGLAQGIEVKDQLAPIAA